MSETTANTREPKRLEELLRIMDVATALRRERERAEAELDVEETKVKLRERLAEAAEATGEVLSAAEIDAAIDQYFTSAHEFTPPKASFQTFLAHLYVRRVKIVTILTVIALLFALMWWLFVAPWGPYSPEGRLRTRLAAATAAFTEVRQSVGELGPDPVALAQIGALESRVESARADRNPRAIEKAADELRNLRLTLSEVYDIVVANPTGGTSAVRQDFTDERGTRVSGYYLILHARDPEGDNVRVRIVDQKSGKVRFVYTWAEWVPDTVYERLKADKIADGVLDETLYARKARGRRELEVVMKDDDGEVLERRRQLESWRP